MKIGVLLSGCGVYDGAEIHESVFTMLSIQELGMEYQCIGIDRLQHHVIDHSKGEELTEQRNMLVEAARIARGNIVKLNENTANEIDALVIPGGFGSAKNFTTWAFNGPKGEILPEVKNLLITLNASGKPIVALCVSPVVLAKAMENSGKSILMTIGTSKAPSPYDISGFEAGLQATGSSTIEKGISEIQIDAVNKVITAPCYMMEANMVEVLGNVRQAITALKEMLHAG